MLHCIHDTILNEMIAQTAYGPSVSTLGYGPNEGGFHMRTFRAGALVAITGLLISVLAQRLTANAEITTPLSVTEAGKLLACKTHMTFSEGHGTQVSYLRSDGVEFLWYPGNAVVVRGKWDNVEHPNDPWKFADICFQYGVNTYNPVTSRTGGNPECRPAHAFVRSTVDRSNGDVFGLAKRAAVPFDLPRERTTISDLRKLARQLDASAELGSDRGCD
jgi:hypothetical protein